MRTHGGSDFTQFTRKAVCPRNSLLEQERFRFLLLLDFDRIKASESGNQQLNIPKLVWLFLTAQGRAQKQSVGNRSSQRSLLEAQLSPAVDTGPVLTSRPPAPAPCNADQTVVSRRALVEPGAISCICTYRLPRRSSQAWFSLEGSRASEGPALTQWTLHRWTNLGAFRASYSRSSRRSSWALQR